MASGLCRAYAVGWVISALVGLIVEGVRLNSNSAPPRWLGAVGWVCAMWLMGPLAIIAAPLWAARRAPNRRAAAAWSADAS
jgi:hypothetical protein